MNDAPIPVVMFGSGPRLTREARKFLCLLEDHPEISLRGAFCQAEGQTLGAVVRDLWRRRGVLALPLLLVQAGEHVGRFLTHARAEAAFRNQLARLSDRIHFVPHIHADEVLRQVRDLSPALGLIYGSPILRPKLFEIPRHGTLGIHHGKVPEYRGNKTMFWAIYNGEKTAGVTIQKVNAGLDKGEIVKEGAVPIGHRSQRAIWRELEALGFRLYIEAILEVKRGEATFRPQTGPKGKLYRNPRPGDFVRLWGRRLKRRFTGESSVS